MLFLHAYKTFIKIDHILEHTGFDKFDESNDQNHKSIFSDHHRTKLETSNKKTSRKFPSIRHGKHFRLPTGLRSKKNSKNICT